MCAYTHRGWAHRQRVSTTFDWKTVTNFSCAPDGVRTSGLWILSPTLCQLSHPVTRHPILTASLNNDSILLHFDGLHQRKKQHKHAFDLSLESKESRVVAIANVSRQAVPLCFGAGEEGLLSVCSLEEGETINVWVGLVGIPWIHGPFVWCEHQFDAMTGKYAHVLINM